MKVLPPKNKEKVEDMLHKYDSMMTSNVGKTLVAKKRMIIRQLNEG